jgi:hypothetical protein
MNKWFAVEMPRGEFNVPQCCCSCLGPADSTYQASVVTGQDSREEFHWTSTTVHKTTYYSSITLPYCRRCQQLAKKGFAKEKKILAIGWSIAALLIIVAVAFLSWANHSALNIDPDLLCNLNLGIVLGIAVLTWIWARRSVSQTERLAHKIAVEPVRRTQKRENWLQIRNGTWAELFAQANGKEVYVFK